MKLNPIEFLLAAVVCLAGCAGSQGSADVGPTDGQDGSAADDGSTGSDVDLGENFGLLVPAGTQLCSMFAAPGWSYDIFLEYRVQARLTLKAGTVRLPKDQASFEVNWIELVELGPEKTKLVPLAPGKFSRTIEGTATDGLYVYEFRQPYEFKSGRYELAYRVEFQVSNGKATAPLLELNEGEVVKLFGFTGTIQRGDGSPDDVRWFSTCRYEIPFARARHEIRLANGDQLTMHLRTTADGCFPPGQVCGGGPGRGRVVRAIFVRGPDRREVDDFFRLAFAAAHHLDGQSMLVVFDQAVGDMKGVWIDQLDYSDTHPNGFYFLDANLNSIGSSPITSYEIVPE